MTWGKGADHEGRFGDICPWPVPGAVHKPLSAWPETIFATPSDPEEEPRALWRFARDFLAALRAEERLKHSQKIKGRSWSLRCEHGAS
ncbi:hypothetical protein GCM10010160_18940 [Acrocarpospora corrugata]